MCKYELNDILSLIRGKYNIAGDAKERYFSNLKPILEADSDSLVFIGAERKDKIDLIRQTRAQIIICDMTVNLAPNLFESKCLIQVDNPKLVFLRIGNALFKIRSHYGIHPSAVIHPDADIHQDTYIGPFTYIGRCSIGEGTFIYGHAHLYDKTVVGKNVIIHAGCVIGADGYGYIKNENDELENFPHIAGVTIKDNVEIGGQTNIDRGALSNTILMEGAKIDTLVHIGHNAVVGRHSLVMADAMIGGSTVIGDYAWISPSSVLRDQIKIGERAMVGLGSVVTKDIPAGETWVGSPARPLNEFLAIQKNIKKLVEQE